MRLIDADALLEREKVNPFFVTVGARDGKSLHNACLTYMAVAVDDAPTIDAVPVETVAQMFMDFTGDKCACNFNDTDGWLPFYCEHEANGKCPDPENALDCWKQYIKHYEKRNEDGDGNG